MAAAMQSFTPCTSKLSSWIGALARNGRGASAAKDAGRLGYTLTPMSPKMAEACGVKEKALRRSLIRMDSAKVNIAPPTVETIWFRLVGVPLGNRTDAYPNGDNVHTVERWHAPDAHISVELANRIIDAIDKGTAEGRRYSDAPASTDRAAWRIVQEFCPTFTDTQCRKLVADWIAHGALRSDDYHDPKARRTTKGLFAGTRPGSSLDS